MVILTFCLIFLIFKPNAIFNLRLPLELGLSYKGGWNITEQVIKHNPILGTGPQTFVYNYSLYKPESINKTIFWNIGFINGPSEFFSLVSEIGILGLLAILAAIFFLLIETIKKFIANETESDQLIKIKIGLFSGWIALIAAWFLYPQNLSLLFLFWLLFTLLAVFNAEEKDFQFINLKTSSKFALITSFGFIILMITIAGFLYLEGNKFIAEINYKNGLTLVNEGKLDAGIDKIIGATITNPHEDKFYRNLAQLFIIQIRENLNNQNLNQEDRTNKVQLGINNAINSASRATVLNSKNVANWVIRGSVYQNLMPLIEGSDVWAIKSYEEALRLEPNNPSTQTEIARTYVNGATLLSNKTQKDEQTNKQINEYLNKAAEAYEKAIEIKPDYSPAHFELALVFASQGRIKEAIVKMENSKKLNPKDVGVAFQLGVLYYKDSQFNKAKTEFERTIALDENYSNAHYFLGLILDKEGNREEAIKHFEKIAQLNPDNDAIKQILANLKANKPALGSGTKIPEQPKEIPIEEEQPDKLKTKLPGK